MSVPMALDTPQGEKADWMQDAAEAIDALAARSAKYDTTFTADDLRKMIGEPGHPNWTGTAFSAARQNRVIEMAGFTTSTAKSRHRGVIRTWRAAA